MNNPFDEIHSRMNILEALIHKLLRKVDKTEDIQRMSRKNIVETYGVSYGTIHNAMKNGDLLFSKIGRKTIFKRSDVETWANLR